MTKHIQEKDPAKNVPLSDIIAPGLDVLFCGINPGLLAAATGYPFAGRGNRFWRTLHLSGFTSREFVPSEAQQLLAAGCGITSVVERATAGVSDLSPDEFMESREAFVAKVTRYSPRFVAFLGKAGLVGVTGRSRVEWADKTSASPIALCGYFPILAGGTWLFLWEISSVHLPFFATQRPLAVSSAHTARVGP